MQGRFHSHGLHHVHAKISSRSVRAPSWKGNGSSSYLVTTKQASTDSVGSDYEVHPDAKWAQMSASRERNTSRRNAACLSRLGNV